MSKIPISARPSLATAVALLQGSELPTEDLTESHLEHLFAAGPPESLVGLVGLELCGGVALLRSLALDPRARTTGMGSQLVAHAEAYARARDILSIYLLTTTAEAFLAARGYARTDRATAPQSIQTTREFSSLCPTSSAFMVKHLQESRK
jgi:amino-acid N-acetyltransferase